MVATEKIKNRIVSSFMNEFCIKEIKDFQCKVIERIKIQSRVIQSMTCKDAINSDTSSDEEKLYLLNEIRKSSKILYVI